MQNQSYFYILAIENKTKIVSFAIVSKTYNVNKRHARPLH